MQAGGKIIVGLPRKVGRNEGKRGYVSAWRFNFHTDPERNIQTSRWKYSRRVDVCGTSSKIVNWRMDIHLSSSYSCPLNISLWHSIVLWSNISFDNRQQMQTARHILLSLYRGMFFIEVVGTVFYFLIYTSQFIVASQKKTLSLMKI